MSIEIPKEEMKERREVLRKILRNYRKWEALVQDEGLYTINVGGEEVHFYDVLEGLDTLPPRQREALELTCLQDMRQVDAAKVMGISDPTTVQQYIIIALEKLVRYQVKLKRGGETGGEGGRTEA